MDARRRDSNKGMPVSAKTRQRQITTEISKLGPCLPGNLVERTTRCVSPRCRCHHDPDYRHGPYPTWSRKIGERSVTRTLNPAQAERYRPMFDNARRLHELVTELQQLTAQQVEQAEGWATHPGDDSDDIKDNPR